MNKFAYLLLVCSSPAICQINSPARITVDNSFPPVLQRDLQAVASDVWLIISNCFGQSKPPLDLPIICYWKRIPPVGSPQFPHVPETTLDNPLHPKVIMIGLAVDGPYWAQFAYQLGHELGHVMLDPRRTNGVVETIASAISYEVLDRLADRWQMIVPFPHMRGWGKNFSQYRMNDEQTRLARLPEEMRLAVSARDWIAVRQYLYKNRIEQNQTSQAEIGSEHGRDVQALGAMSLRSGPVQWKKLAGLAVSCSSVPLSKRVVAQPPTPFSAKCLPGLSGVLCPIGRGCAGLMP